MTEPTPIRQLTEEQTAALQAEMDARKLANFEKWKLRNWTRARNYYCWLRNKEGTHLDELAWAHNATVDDVREWIRDCIRYGIHPDTCGKR
jgi:hypothetical protein